jgi:enediyne biosynthesis protein E4
MSQPPDKQPDEHEELVHADDKVIGRAVNWSLAALGAILVLAVAGYFVFKPKPKPAEKKVTELSVPVAPERPRAEIPDARFTDITRTAGITFVHNNGAYGDKLLPESMGSGCAFFDFDNDGDADLLFVNSTWWQGKVPPAKSPTTAALYQNDGQGRFTDVTRGSGLDVSLYGMGVACGDFDNDGRVDVYLTAVGENRLFRNLGGGKFADVTAPAGVAGPAGEWSTGAAFADMDNDGDLDLFVVNYVRWSKEIDFEVGYSLTGIGRAYGPPMNFQGTYPLLYRNDGGGKFTDISATSGVQVKSPFTGAPMAKSLGIAPVDLNGDGWLDFIVANDTVQNFVFLNQRDGTFKEVGGLTGVAFDGNGNARGAMGIDTARFRNDGALAIGIANFANEMTALYVASARDPMVFTDEAIATGIGPESRLLLKFGLFFFDYDLDGWQDVLSCNGHLEEEINKVQASQQYRQPAQLFWNAEGRVPGKGFVAAGPDKAGGDLFQPIVGRGSAFADVDGDGDLDAVLTQTGGAPLLLRNDQKLGHHWIRFKLEGKGANRDAIGAWVTLKAGGQTLSQQVMPTRSYLSQSELPVTFGLGTNTVVEDVTVIWPGNATQKVANAQVDKVNAVRQEP